MTSSPRFLFRGPRPKPIHLSLLPCILALLIAGYPIAYAQQQPGLFENITIKNYKGLHSYGYGELISLLEGFNATDLNFLLNLTALANSVPASDLERYSETYSQLASCDTLSCVVENGSVSSDLMDLALNIRDLDQYPSLYEDTQLTLSLSELNIGGLQYILNDPELFSVIAELYSKGQVSESDIRSAFDLFKSLYSGGEISYRQYMAALELLRRLADARGMEDLSREIDSEMLNAFNDRTQIKRLLEGLSYLKDLRLQEGELSQQVGQNQQISGFKVDSIPKEFPIQQAIESVSQPGMGLPGLDFSAISNLFSSEAVRNTLIYISIAVVLIIVLVYYSRIHRAITAAVSQPRIAVRSIYTVPSDIDVGVVKRYWDSVRKLSRKIPISDSDTHREYLEKISRSMGEIQWFKDLTYLYEKVRFGHMNIGVEEERSR